MALGKVEALEATIGGNRAFCSRHGIGYHCAQSLVKAAYASCRILMAFCMLYTTPYCTEIHIVVRLHIHILIM
jgi:hypothetical protein